MAITLADITTARAAANRDNEQAAAAYHARVHRNEQAVKDLLAEAVRDGHSVPTLTRCLGIARTAWYIYFTGKEMAQLRTEAAQREAARSLHEGTHDTPPS